MTNESDQNALHLVDTHVYMLDHTAVKHPGWHVSAGALVLQLLEAPQHNALTPCEAVSNIGEVIATIMIWHKNPSHGPTTMMLEAHIVEHIVSSA